MIGTFVPHESITISFSVRHSRTILPMFDLSLTRTRKKEVPRKNAHIVLTLFRFFSGIIAFAHIC